MTRIGLRSSCVVNRIVARMSTTKCSYEDAIRKLNALQSNKSTIEQIKKSIKSGQKCTNIEDMENYLARTGVPLTKLDELSVIHVAGTKGKGSTSAMCESILRQHGLRTGFYSSPHLVAARERVRLGGRPLSELAFATHFHRVYEMLHDTQEYEGDMPKYFAFLTVMAYNVFLTEKVDVAVIEVGIGGIVDYTNVLRKVPVVGITALGLDHTSILGHTLPEIAAAKAGVMKPGCAAYTVRQPADAMQVLRQTADAVKCSLTIAPDYNTYTFPESQKPNLQVNLEAYRTNASLAIQLAHSWLRTTQGSLKKNGFKNDVAYGHNGLKNGVNLGQIQYEVPSETMEGLKLCIWPGRYQVVQREYATFFLDGAHTKESMEICAQWFTDSNSRCDKILIFSATGDRNAETLLKPLSGVPFKHVYCVIPTAHRATTDNNDNYSIVEQQELIQRCRNNAHAWGSLSRSNVTVLECVSDALLMVKEYYLKEKPSVLITGSLHLVGAALSILDPNLTTFMIKS